MADRIVLHVGTPKTGTSMVQDMLARNAESLRRHDVLVPGGAFDHQYRAGLDLLDESTDDSRGAWDRLAAQVRRHRGTAIISNEILSRAEPEQVARAASTLGAPAFDVVVSVRDLGRQVPSGWQEAVKHRARLSFSAFVEALHADPPTRRVARGFWAVQDWPTAAERWGALTSPERVHIVTVPPSTADPDVLRTRMLTAMGIEPAWVPTPPQRGNTRLGAAEARVLRGINTRVRPDAVDAGAYAEFVRDRLVRAMAERADDPIRIRLDPAEYDWVAEISRRWIDDVRARGYDIVGDLDELRPVRYDDWTDPDAVEPAVELAAANNVIDALLTGQVAERNDNVDRFYEIARAYARRRAGRLRTVRGILRTKSRLSR
ncbi:hypothetical protein [Solicola gregarius]|uniref:Sulfotransferase family protein n=1 Tax=Solicola gregarius TaxID=2908642 RepID=A0AA46TJE9_9ACTN|nr:hypothetical protein [Solicola gregarius]UYM05942.1 hypothetical protein L0C25_02385 [Solicola gregarius]